MAAISSAWNEDADLSAEWQMKTQRRRECSLAVSHIQTASFWGFFCVFSPSLSNASVSAVLEVFLVV